jgi:hypothetical protein
MQRYPEKVISKHSLPPSESIFATSTRSTVPKTAKAIQVRVHCPLQRGEPFLGWKAKRVDLLRRFAPDILSSERASREKPISRE